MRTDLEKMGGLKRVVREGLLAGARLFRRRGIRTRTLAAGLSADLARLLRPQAASRWLMPQVAAMTPAQIETVLRGGLAGDHVQAWELFNLMEDTSPRLLKNLNELKRAVVGMDWKVWPYQQGDEAPTKSAQEKARLVSAAVRGMRPKPAADENDFSGTVYDVLDAWAKGQSVVEVEWELREASGLSEIWAPRSTFWVHPTCVAWDSLGRLGLREDLKGAWMSRMPQADWDLGADVAEFPEHRFLVSICRAKSGTAWDGALLRPLAWWWCAGNFSAEWLLQLAQIFGLPLRWATYDPNMPEGTYQEMIQMLEKMGSQAWGVFPMGTKMELKEAHQSADHSPQGELLDRAEKQMDLLILGQTLTTDVSKHGGSRALGEVHADVKGEVVQAAANFAASVLNGQLVRSILRLNYGNDREAPEFHPTPRKAEDAAANAERDAMLMQAGVRMPKGWFYKRHDVPLPQAGEETVGSHKPGPRVQKPGASGWESHQSHQSHQSHAGEQ